MTDRKIVFFSVFRHLSPSDYESWLELMAAEGWHINHFRQWNSIVMTFKRGEPKKYRFVYDPQVSPRKEYIATYEQFGWEYLGRMASAHFWRMEYEGERPEAFSDQESIVKRNRSNIAAVSVSFTIFLMTVLIVGILLLFFGDSLSKTDRMQVIIAEGFFGVITIALGAVMLFLRKNESR
jgi:RNA-binding protein YlmH